LLAGGKAYRLGGINKALIEVEGVTVISRTLKILEPLFGRIIIAGWPSGDPLPPGVTAVGDNYPGIGPLAGIEAALRACPSPYLFVFGCDMPWLSEEIITSQARDFLDAPAEILAARVAGLLEPLHSIYGKKIHPSLVSYIEAERSPAVIDFYGLAETRYYDLPVTEKTRRALTNINRPEDISC
jgi:molybdopterin-guanine dinucleotide biosynthesis protein A